MFSTTCCQKARPKNTLAPSSAAAAAQAAISPAYAATHSETRHNKQDILVGEAELTKGITLSGNGDGHEACRIFACDETITLGNDPSRVGDDCDDDCDPGGEAGELHIEM